jgi:uncharacterized membrane protein
VQIEPEPLVIFLVAIPMILKIIPRNRLYGFRTARTLQSDAVWYPANRFAGIAMATAAIVWQIAALVVSGQLELVIGLMSLGLAVAASFFHLRQL